jgi:hypothetical protein
MILVFRASTDCPTVGLLFKPQYEQIPPNVFSREPDSGFGCGDMLLTMPCPLVDLSNSEASRRSTYSDKNIKFTNTV